MLLSLFRKCCCILWKHLSYQQHIIWLFLLVLLGQQLQESDCKTTKWNRSIQRRFMWKQMDSTVDGFVDRVVTGARVVKSMIGDFMPPKQMSGNVMDYLPTETTRIRYIIRNPHTKETKVIRVKPSKKVVKLMAMTPKPLVGDKQPKPMHISDSQYVTVKPKPVHTKPTEHMTADKIKYTYMMAPEKLRKLEKEQEMIAEGRIPMRIETKPIYMAFRAEKPKAAGHNSPKDDNIISGKIKEFSESWKPVYKLGDTPAGFSTSKPYMMSALHTSVVGELLPEPQKQIYEPLLSNYFPEEEPKKSHTYEVTEYAAEESILHPYTHDHYKYEGSVDVPLTQSDESTHEQHFPVSTATPDIVTQIEDDAGSKIYHTEYRSQRGFLPSRGTYRLPEEISTTTTAPSSTTTTEEPNYPALFLQKIRSRPDHKHNSKSLQRQKFSDIPFESNWLPTNTTTYTSHKTQQQVPYHQHLTSVTSLQRIKSQKWPPDAEDSYLNSAPLSAFDVTSTTELPISEEFTTQTATILSNSNSRKNVRLKSPHYSTFSEAKYRSARHRGSVKYGDKLEIENR